ncbi:hypothetical protein HK101_003721 [Irineochytrium annulatum]|nr:hypothetical protein HK101_003721 [Irineochytrium annulatum]
MTAIEGGGLAAPGADEPPPEYTTMPRGLSVNRGDLGGAGEMLQRATSFARDVASPYTRDGITLYPGGPHQQQQREAGTLPDKRSLDLQRVPPPPPSWSAPLEAPQVERTVTQSSSAGVERMLSRTGVDRLETVRTSNSGVVISNNGFIDGAREADKAGEVVEEPEGIEGSDRRDDEAPVEENSAGAGDADARSAGESPGELNTSAVVLADMSRSNSKKSLNSADSQGSTAVNSATLEEEPQKAAVALAVDVQRELPAAPKPTSVSVAPEILTEQLIDVDRELPPTPVPVDVPAAPVVVRNGSSEGQQIASKPLHERPKDLRPNVGGLAMTRSPTVSSSPHRNSEESITAGPTRPRANSDGSSLRTPGMPFQASAVEIDYRGLPPRSGRRSMGTGLIASGVGPALAIPSPPPTHKGDPRLRGSVNGTSSMSQSPPTVYYTGPPPPSPRLQQPAPFFSQSSPTPRDARDPITPTTPTGGAPPRPPLLHESDHKVAQRQAWERYKENMRRQRGEPPPPSPSQQIYAPQLPAPASPRSSIHSSTMSSQASGRSRTFSGGEGYPSPPRSMSGQRHERYGSDDRNNHYPPQAPSPHPLAPPLPPSSLSDGRRPSSPYDRGSTPTATSFPSPPPLSTSSLSPPIHHPFVPSGLGAVVPVAGAWGWSIDTLAVAVPRSSVPARSPPTSDAAAALETEMRMKGVVAEAGVDRPELDAIVSRAAREAWDRECRHGDGRAVGLRSWYAVAGEVLRDGGNRAPVGMSRVLWTGRTTDEAEMYRMLVGRHLVFPQTLARRTAPADAGSEASDDEDDEDVVEDEEKTPAGCPRCGSGCLETPRHVLLMCPTARHLWKRVSRMMERATGMEVGRVTLADVVTGFGRLKSLVETREEAVDEDDDAEDDNERVRARAANQVADVTRVVTSLHAIALHSLVSSRVYPWAGEGCAFMIFRARLASRVAVEADEEEGGEVERAAGCERLEMAVWRALRLDGVGPRRLMGTRTAFGRPAIAAPVVATVDA